MFKFIINNNENNLLLIDNENEIEILNKLFAQKKTPHCKIKKTKISSIDIKIQINNLKIEKINNDLTENRKTQKNIVLLFD